YPSPWTRKSQYWRSLRARNASGCRHHLTQEFQPLCRQLNRESIDAGEVTAGLGEAGDKTKPDRVFAVAENDGDRRGYRLGGERRTSSKCCDHGDPLVKEFGCQYGQSIPLTLRPTVCDPHVLALDVAAVL